MKNIFILISCALGYANSALALDCINLSGKYATKSVIPDARHIEYSYEQTDCISTNFTGQVVKDGQVLEHYDYTYINDGKWHLEPISMRSEYVKSEYTAEGWAVSRQYAVTETPSETQFWKLVYTVESDGLHIKKYNVDLRYFPQPLFVEDSIFPRL